MADVTASSTDDLPDCSPEFHEEVMRISSKFQEEASLQNETWVYSFRLVLGALFGILIE